VGKFGTKQEVLQHEDLRTAHGVAKTSGISTGRFRNSSWSGQNKQSFNRKIVEQPMEWPKQAVFQQEDLGTVYDVAKTSGIST
jgi:hypothetical protein